MARAAWWASVPLGFWYLGPQPSDEAGGFLLRPLGVQGDHTVEDFSVLQGRGPALGGENGGVEVIVELAENGDEALIVDLLFFLV